MDSTETENVELVRPLSRSPMRCRQKKKLCIPRARLGDQFLRCGALRDTLVALDVDKVDVSLDCRTGLASYRDKPYSLPVILSVRVHVGIGKPSCVAERCWYEGVLNASTLEADLRFKGDLRQRRLPRE